MRKRGQREEIGMVFSRIKVFSHSLTSEGTVKSCTVTLLACKREREQQMQHLTKQHITRSIIPHL